MMPTVKIPKSLVASDRVRQVAAETAAFEIVSDVDGYSTPVVRQNQEWDEIITLLVKPDQRRVDLFVITRQQLLPNMVFGLLQKHKTIGPEGGLLLWAPYISPRVAEMCREQNVSYLDGAGNCWIVAPGLFVHIAGRPNHPPQRKAVDPFSQKSSRIVRTLLTQPSKGWQVQQLAKHADVSIGLVSKVKTTLLEEAYLEERDRLLFVRDAVKLLRGWSAEYRPQVR
ncbi:MAG: hypothetical protein ACRCZF_02175, partial [Gemmataceae bacterium]